jgi:septum formation protein
VRFTVRPSGVPEVDAGDPVEVAVENALRKARAARWPISDRSISDRQDAHETVLGVDTLVTRDGAIYGKPPDERAARVTLSALSGATHQVISGLALLLADEQRTAVACTEVVFRALDDRLLDWYIATGEWQGRAGGYAIQGAGAALVRAVRGDYENVVGLPLTTLLDLYPELLGR